MGRRVVDAKYSSSFPLRILYVYTTHLEVHTATSISIFGNVGVIAAKTILDRNINVSCTHKIG